MNIGCHLSIAKGYRAMGDQALALGANTFQFFTRSPRGGKSKAADPADLAALRALLAERRFAPLVAHAPYTLNPCAKDEGLRDFALRVMQEDLALLAQLPGNFYNFHPGCHVGQGVETGVAWIAALLNQVLPAAEGCGVLLETMSGKGSEIGGRFEELRETISRVEGNGALGVCLDTCHVYSAGYDLVNDLDGVLTEFDRVIGLQRLKAVHLNDSLTPFASRKDRHAKIGEGSLGLDAISRILFHPALRDLPFVLETPNELDGYREEIRLLRGLAPA